MDHHHPPLPLTTTTNNTSPSPAPDPAPAPAPDSASTLAPPTASISELRAELKQWERDFAAAHGGRKAGREDIKMVPEIGILIIFHFCFCLRFYHVLVHLHA